MIRHDGNMANLPFERLVPKADPATPIMNGACALVDFWQWAFSDLVSNEVRGTFAEFIVGHALGVLDGPRSSWGAWDLTYGRSKIEVKATGDVQAWAPTGRPPKPSWGIRKAKGWDAATNTSAAEALRSADVYVLCHWQGRDHSPLSPALLDSWSFYVVPTRVLNEQHPDGKNLSMPQLSRLLEAGNARRSNYATLKDTVDQTLDGEAMVQELSK